ncbi:MAG: 2,3-bisphosphoglycerate-independent phosphoglycerate mutase [Alphaproteobacteria bacterium]|nr:2,3-bisphosphoglycerate-independent phosphoglycerate mutase [Alphaproteobacteria bacterium]
MPKPLVLCILDGVGYRSDAAGNAVAQADMPFYNGLLAKYPHTTLLAAGNAVGLPAGAVGNSEVGHITMGSGRIVNQFLRRFEIARAAGNFEASPALDKLANLGTVHVIGLMSDGLVHSSIENTIYLIRILLKKGAKIWIHFISDGRDTPPSVAEKYIGMLNKEFARELACGDLGFATLIGRYYAMDRNQNLDRTNMAIDAIKDAKSVCFPTIYAALDSARKADESDEFIKPRVIDGFKGIGKNDGILLANYRADRLRQITLMLEEYHITAMTSMGEDMDSLYEMLLPPKPESNTLGDILSANGLGQLRIAETEKYTHATYYFDAEREMKYPEEETILVPSPEVATFDLSPKMSAPKITDEVLRRINDFDVIVMNYCNGDIVGHTGKMDAAVKAMEALDAELARLVPAAIAAGGAVIITADHGNIEEMVDGDGMPKTAHTANPVPFIFVADDAPALKTGLGLSSVAPTILKILGVKKPSEMTGESLI